jgi:hypothetical protein
MHFSLPFCRDDAKNRKTFHTSFLLTALSRAASFPKGRYRYQERLLGKLNKIKKGFRIQKREKQGQD